MKRFAALSEVLDRTTSTNEKVAALAGYFAAAPPEDAAWAVFFLTGQRFKRLLPARSLALWALETVNVPEWLFDESYASVGDLAETIALLLDGIGGEGSGPDLPLSVWVTERILPLRDLPPEEQRVQVTAWWTGLDRWETFVLNKMLTGALRAGVSQTLVERALARVAGVDPAVVAHRLMGAWEPTPSAYLELLAPDTGSGEDGSRPYNAPPETLGKTEDDTHTLDAVLVYAQPGHGWRASLLTDYTFAVWSEGESGNELVPVTKAYSGLSDPEILELDGWIRRHTVQKFGPVRAVEPVQVFELAFEGIALSPRHRSGIAVRFPRIARWRRDKTPEEADTLEGVKAMLPHP